MRIIRAEHLGMCFGVRDAIEMAEQQAREGPVTILGELVHNPSVLDRLQQQGIRIESDMGKVKAGTVMITAHGISDRRRQEVERSRLRVLETTCPLVEVAHRAVAGLVAAGYHPVIVGKRDHVEVRGLTEDLEAFDVILEERDVEMLVERPRFGVASQTTQPVERVRRLVGLVRARFPASEVRFVDTVCQPTKQRQNAAIELAQRCDVLVVIGGLNSNNTRELVETSRRYCARVEQVQSAAELCPHWFREATTVGITAGTSTPDEAIDAVEQRLLSWACDVAPAMPTHGSSRMAAETAGVLTEVGLEPRTPAITPVETGGEGGMIRST
jgi:4-hydroxy-3-methylbut-2-en-1-yl diphosphate reductase